MAMKRTMTPWKRIRTLSLSQAAQAPGSAVSALELELVLGLLVSDDAVLAVPVLVLGLVLGMRTKKLE
jgi:hypothetical protein